MKTYRKNLPVSAGIAFCVLLLAAAPSATFAAGPASVDLSSAGTFAILAKSGISTTGSTVVVGDIGVSPTAATSITGFSLSLPSAGAYSTSPEVSGKVYAPDYAAPTPATLTAAVGAMETAYTDAAGRTNPTATELGAGNIGGLTIAPGLYKWGTGVIVPSDVTLSGSANDVWIFQIGETLTLSSSVKVTLAGGAQAANVFWIVAGQTTVGTGATMNGIILDQTGIVLNTGAVLNGHAFAQTAVTLDANAVTISAKSTVATVLPVQPVIVVAPPVAPPIVSSAGGFGSGTVSTGSSNGTNSYSYQNALPLSAQFGQQVKMIAVSLGQGNKGAGVEALQQFLISQNKGAAASSLGRVGATAYFGPLTRAALAEFQSTVGISPAIGNFGPVTRGYFSTHY